MKWLLRRLLALWVRYVVRPEDAAQALKGLAHPVCYVLEQPDATDFAVLHNACAKLRLPRPGKRLLAADSQLRSAASLSSTVGVWNQRLDRRPPAWLRRLLELLEQDPALDVELVPVAVYWGRAPQKEGSWFRLLFTEDWTFASRMRKFLRVLINGRSTLVEFDAPVSLRALAKGGGDIAVQSRRVTRTLRALYRRRRAARIGPDLSHRRTIVSQVLRTRAVRAAVAQEIRTKKLTRREGLQLAQKYAEEIAANYSHRFIRFMEHLLTWTWNRLYDGVVFEHSETLGEVAEGHEIVYVPCHRSHMDYLLLSYVIYRQGYAIPHIAAGINLDMPVLGRFLRKGGAFFIRRRFAGNALYTVVFMKYLAAMMGRGHSIEYFVEGGRSRTGRLLQPHTGMISMTVRSYLREPVRPVVFVPVYFGYERIVEGSTYVHELSGKPKEKESVLGLLRTLPKLRERFGTVHVNVGEPIPLDPLLARYEPGWRARAGAAVEDTRIPWVARAVAEIASSVMRNINAAAAVTPVSLLAVVLLSTPKRTLAESDLLRQMALYQSLLKEFPYGERVTVTALAPAEIVKYGESMKLVDRREHALGNLVQMREEVAVLATYYRNNVLHLFAMPSLLACAFGGNAALRTEDLQRLAWRIYPYIASELFLPWTEAELPAVVERHLRALAAHGLIEAGDAGLWRRPPPSSAQAVQLSLLAQIALQVIERYYLAIALLLRAGSGAITQKALEQRCQLMAQRMGMLYGLDSPEFFDRALFENFIDLLRARGVIRGSSDGTLLYDDVLVRVAEDAQLVLSEQIRHSILQVTHA